MVPRPALVLSQMVNKRSAMNAREFTSGTSPRLPAKCNPPLNAAWEPPERTMGLAHLLKNNADWAAAMARERPGFFEALSKQQSPELLWIGCSDSRVPSNQLLNLPPGEVFVHRNIANCVNHTDLNALSVLQYSVDVLKVRHVIVCGHYGCGGIAAAFSNAQFGLIDNWLRNIKDVYDRHKKQIDQGPDLKSKLDHLTELNVARSVENICHTTIVQNAWARGQDICVHGWCYHLNDGKIADLQMCVSRLEQIRDIYDVVTAERPLPTPITDRRKPFQ